MSSKSRGVRFWISAWLPVLIGIAAIVTESTQAFGTDHTGYPLRWLLQLIFGPISDSTFDVIHHIIRKSGHFIGYGLIGFAWLRAWWMTLPRSRFLTDAVLALLGTALLATWDEWHQSFLPNRGSSPWDVLLDCCGATAMYVLIYLLMRFYRPQRLDRAA
jgi:VanZ family protein